MSVFIDNIINRLNRQTVLNNGHHGNGRTNGVSKIRHGSSEQREVVQAELDVGHDRDHEVQQIVDQKASSELIQPGNGFINKHQVIRNILGMPTCYVNPKLETDEDLVTYLTSYVLDRIGYFDSYDFREKVLPDEEYLIIGDRKKSKGIYIESLDNDSKRMFILGKIFKGDFDEYLRVFASKLPNAAKTIFKQYLFKELEHRTGDKYESAISVLTSESPGNIQKNSAHGMTGTYDWAISIINENPEVAERLYCYFRDHRYFCRDVVDGLRDPVMNSMIEWIKKSPGALSKVLSVFDSLFEEVPCTPNKLSYELDCLEVQVKELAKEIQLPSGSLASLFGIASKNSSSKDVALLPVDTVILPENMPMEEVFPFYQEKIREAIKKIVNQEIEAVQRIKLKARRQFIKKASAWAGGTVLASTIIGGVALSVHEFNIRAFNQELSRVESQVNPLLRINYERTYEQAVIEMGSSYPPEARDTRDRTQYLVQTNARNDFYNALNNKYFKVLAAYLTPQLLQTTRNLIRNGAVIGLPHDLRTNLTDDLRNLFTASEWNYPRDAAIAGRIYYGLMIGQGMTNNGILQPAILELPRAYGSVAAFLHPMPFPAIRNDSYIDENTRQMVLTDRFIEPPAESKVFGGVEPRDYIDKDQNYLNIVQALNEMLARLQRRKQEVLAAYEESNEAQELNLILNNARAKMNISSARERINELVHMLEQRQDQLVPLIRALARCECRLRDLIDVRLPNRVNDIKTRNSYRALLLE